MKDKELIAELRKQADIVEYPEMEQAMREAADRIEQLSERIDIMAADMDREWGKSY